MHAGMHGRWPLRVYRILQQPAPSTAAVSSLHTAQSQQRCCNNRPFPASVLPPPHLLRLAQRRQRCLDTKVGRRVLCQPAGRSKDADEMLALLESRLIAQHEGVVAVEQNN